MIRRAVIRVGVILVSMLVLGSVSAFGSRDACEDRVAHWLMSRAQMPSFVYVWPADSPILRRNGVDTRVCVDDHPPCYPVAIIHRAEVDGPFVTSVRWQYSRDHHGSLGVRRFFCLFGMVFELKPGPTAIQ